jgi:hypothetical protein
MPTLQDDLDAAAVWIARALASSGYLADFSLSSLRSVDRFIDDHSTNGTPAPGGLLAQDLGGRLFALGAYRFFDALLVAPGVRTTKLPTGRSTSRCSCRTAPPSGQCNA